MNPKRYRDPTQPFARSQAKAFTNGQPYLGGRIALIVGPQVANTNFAINHTLKIIPRFALVLDAGTASLATPVPRGTSPWSRTQIFLNLPAVAAGVTVTLLIA